MSILTSIGGAIGGFLNNLFKGFPRAHDNYYSPDDCYGFNKEKLPDGVLRIYVPKGTPRQAEEGLKPYRDSMSELGFLTVVTDNIMARDKCQVWVIHEAANASGGSTHKQFAKFPDGTINPREIVWAKISIALSEKGESLKKTVCHESTHLFKDGHSEDERDASFPKNRQTKYSKADKKTHKLAQTQPTLIPPKEG